MTDNVVQMRPKRGDDPGPDTYRPCSCGEAWFDFLPVYDYKHPKVAITLDGRVTSYAGMFVCSSCGKDAVIVCGGF